MDRGAWRAASPRGCRELDTTKQLTHTLRELAFRYEEVVGKASAHLPGEQVYSERRPWWLRRLQGPTSEVTELRNRRQAQPWPAPVGTDLPGAGGEVSELAATWLRTK